MLVLSRKAGQTVVLSGGIRVTVTAVIGSKVKLGFEAPDGVEIWREEVAIARASGERVRP